MCNDVIMLAETYLVTSKSALRVASRFCIVMLANFLADVNRPRENYRVNRAERGWAGFRTYTDVVVAESVEVLECQKPLPLLRCERHIIQEQSGTRMYGRCREWAIGYTRFGSKQNRGICPFMSCFSFSAIWSGGRDGREHTPETYLTRCHKVF